MRAARGVKPKTEVYGGVAYDEADAAPDNDFVPCPTCGRTFNEKAADRHIQHCATRAKNNALRQGPPPRAKKAQYGRFGRKR